MVGAGRSAPSSPVLPCDDIRRHRRAHQRPHGAGVDRQIAPPGELDHLARVRLGQRQRHVAGDRGDREHLELFRRGERQQGARRRPGPGRSRSRSLAASAHRLLLARRPSQTGRRQRNRLPRSWNLIREGSFEAGDATVVASHIFPQGSEIHVVEQLARIVAGGLRAGADDRAAGRRPAAAGRRCMPQLDQIEQQMGPRQICRRNGRATSSRSSTVRARSPRPVTPRLHAGRRRARGSDADPRGDRRAGPGRPAAADRAAAAAPQAGPVSSRPSTVSSRTEVSAGPAGADRAAAADRPAGAGRAAAGPGRCHGGNPVQQPQPQITVTQPQPEVTVHVPAPQVTIRMPQPEVIVRMPEPQVDIQMAEPEVQVSTPQPEVQVSMPQPEVQIERSSPTSRCSRLSRRSCCRRPSSRRACRSRWRTPRSPSSARRSRPR